MPEEHRAAAPGAAPTPSTHAEVLTEEDVYEALEEVIDPELGLDFVSLGLVYDVDDREGGRLRHLHPDHPRLPDRPPGLRTDEGVRRRPPRRLRGPPEDGLRPRLVPGNDDRRRQVRPRLLGTVCGVTGGHRGSVLSPCRPHGRQRGSSDFGMPTGRFHRRGPPYCGSNAHCALEHEGLQGVRGA